MSNENLDSCVKKKNEKLALKLFIKNINKDYMQNCWNITQLKMKQTITYAIIFLKISNANLKKTTKTNYRETCE